jgi:4,5-DOPA dioxygenase extradiol
MPVLFLGHGSPMNAVESNEFTMGWSLIGAKLPRPKAILCISAHWETKGTWVTAMQHPRTIHDFGGFPAQLYDIQYPAPGSPELAQETTEVITATNVGLDRAWGLDHGCWSVIKHLYPLADIPVIQMSLDHNLSPLQHYELAKELSDFRNKDVLIVGSGNMVHNLGMVAWDKVNAPEYGYDWAMEASSAMKKLILAGDHKKLIHYEEQGRAFKLAIPTAEHYLPLIYALALQEKGEETRLFNDKAVMGSLTMTSVVISGT